MALQTMQGVTPTVRIRVPSSIDLTEANKVYFSIRQGRRLLIIDDPEVEAHVASTYLDQEQTLSFSPGEATMMLNWTYPSGQRGATRKIPIMFDENHILEVLQ